MLSIDNSICQKKKSFSILQQDTKKIGPPERCRHQDFTSNNFFFIPLKLYKTHWDEVEDDDDDDET